MVVKNLTKKTFLSLNCKFVSTWQEIIFGLHWLSNPPSLLFKTRFGLHSLFLKQPVDILVLNDNLKVAGIKENFAPNGFFFWHPKFQYVLELPAGTVKKSKTLPNDQLIFEPEVKKK